MYELKRQDRIREQLKLGEEVLTIEIVPETIAQDYKKAEAKLIKAQDMLRAAKAGEQEASYQELGDAVVTLLNVVLGKDNTDKLLLFYENSYTEMMLMIMPFIMDVIKPQLDSMIVKMQNTTREVYKKGKYGNKWNRGSQLFRG